MENLKATICDIISHCCDVKTFRLKLEREVFYKAGQYLSLTLRIGGRGAAKIFSISSSPTEKGHIDFTKKLTGSDFSKALNALKPGDEVSLRMPMGHFTLKDEYQKIAFLSGGIGITPIRSILKYATDTNLAKDFILLYSSRSLEYLIFKDDFDRMIRSNKRLRVIYTITGDEGDTCGFESGCINAEMIKDKISDYHERTFFICGPPGMVRAMHKVLLEELNVDEKQIVTEDFTGY